MKKYFLGLDIGTNSVGFAVTDENYNILRAKGQKLWGVRLFQEAKTASDRRLKRTNRRRLLRKKMQKEWLNEIFAPQLAKVDKQFLTRLKYSNLWREDKEKIADLTDKYSLFGKNSTIDGIKYSDNEFFKEYPTIFHLRNQLLHTPAKDVRLLYLAVLNLLKARGNFLYEADFSQSAALVPLLQEFLDDCNLLEENFIDLRIENLKNLEAEILQCFAQKTKIKDLKNKCYVLFGATNKFANAVVDCFVSGKLNLKTAFGVEEKFEIDFGADDADEKMEKANELLSDDLQKIVADMQKIYASISLKKFLKNHNFVCQAMIEKYDAHKQQLKDFRQFIHQYYFSQYNIMFRAHKDNTNCNYPAYVGRNVIGGQKRPIFAERAQKNFYAFVKSIISAPPETAVNLEQYEKQKSAILAQIEAQTFLPLQRTKENGVLPNALLKAELQQILKTNSAKFDFLLQKDQTGLCAKEKIEDIFSFRVPYFVGPICGQNSQPSQNCWAEQTANVKLYPWTIRQIVDYDKSEDNFIKRMTNKCTYLHSEDVLPKQSLLYSKYRVLNELNNLKINAQPITTEQKQKIFTELFEKHKKVTTNQLRRFLQTELQLDQNEMENLTISGIDKEFANNLGVWVDFVGILGREFVENNQEILENIIKWGTIIADKLRFEKRIKKYYPEVFSGDQLKKIKALSFKDWGRLSKKFLSGLLFADQQNGETTTVINELWNTQNNLQQIMDAKKYSLSQKIYETNLAQIETLNHGIVEDLYCSPAVKRAVWQTLQIVEEIVQVLGQKPAKIFIEVTRKDETKGDAGRKLARKDNLLKIYESKDFKSYIKKEANGLAEVYEELKNKDNLALRSETLYLYFLQHGRCAYTGDKIDINALMTKNSLYDVDHIIPQAIFPDDSFQNKVLAKKQNNSIKDKNYPLAKYFPDWVERMQPLWKIWLKQGLMTAEKYDRLIRKDFSEEQQQQFVARQLVETTQANKAVMDILKKYVEKPTDIVASRAHFVTDFRNCFGLRKSREVNDFHHAQDAYLNIVVGYVLFNRYAQNSPNFHQDDENENKDESVKICKIFNNRVHETYTKKLVWNGRRDKERVKQVASKNDCMVSYLSYPILNGAYYEETLHKSLKNNAKSEARCPLKGAASNPLADVQKYGGYSGLTTGYFMAIESDAGKKGRKTTIEAVPVYIYQKYKNCADKDAKILDFVVKENNLINAKVLCPQINIYSILKINKGEYLLSGRTGNDLALHNFNQWHVTPEIIEYVKVLTKYNDMKLQNRLSELIEQNNEIILAEREKKEKNIVLSKEKNTKFYETIIAQTQKNVYQGLQIANLPQALLQGKEKFASLSILEQADLLLGVIQRLGRGAKNANLSLLDMPKNFAKLKILKNITGKNVRLIKRSVTGLFEKVERL